MKLRAAAAEPLDSAGQERLEREHAQLIELTGLLERERQVLAAPDADRLNAIAAEKRERLLDLSELHEANERLRVRTAATTTQASLRQAITLATEEAHRLNAANAQLLALHSQATHARLETLRTASGANASSCATYTENGLIALMR